MCILMKLFSNSKLFTMFQNKIFKAVLYGGLTLLFGYFFLRATMFTYVKPNQVGIWMTNGGMNGQSDYQIWQGYFPIDFTPLTKSFVLPAQSYSVDLDKAVVLSKENGEWTVDPQFTFSLDRSQAVTVCHRFNSFVDNNDDEVFLKSVGTYILTPIIRNSFTEIIGSLKDTVMMDNKVLVQKMLEDSVRVAFNRVGFRLENFVTGITPPQSILATNQAKNQALQAVYAAKADVEKANAQAVVKMATARADAEAMLVTARADAEARRLKQQTLSPLLIQAMWIDRWDGKVSQNNFGNANLLFQIPTNQ